MAEENLKSLDLDQVETTVTRTEVANIRYFGYGVSSFTLSLIETAVDLTDGRVTSADLRSLVHLAKGMMSEQIDVFDGVRDTLSALVPSVRSKRTLSQEDDP